MVQDWFEIDDRPLTPQEAYVFLGKALERVHQDIDPEEREEISDRDRDQVRRILEEYLEKL
jgi:hypothetical protein